MNEVYYQKKFVVDINHIDFKGELKLSALFTYFQDIANCAAERLGLGLNNLINEYGVTWTLIRIRVDIKRIPKWNEEISIETWPIEPKTLEFERDFIVKDSLGNTIIKAVTSWIILDIKERKIRKTSVINAQYPQLLTERAIVCNLGKFKANEQLEPVYKKVIGYSDIDFNGHLNNSKYIDYIMDCFTLDKHQNFFIKSIEVSFINEALMGDTITLFISKLKDGVVYIEGLNDKDHKITFKAQLLIEKR